MIRYVAVIDLGKTNSKVALVDTQNANELDVLTQPAASNTDAPYPSLDHEAIKTFIITSLQALGGQHTIDAMTVTTHGATVALLDASGELAFPVMDYEFQRIDDTRAHYETLRPPFSETGSPALPGGLNIGAQLVWQQTHYPEQFANVTTILTWPQYWVYVLTGRKHNDVSSLGAHSDLYAPVSQRYSSLIERQDWEALLPPTQLSGKLSGTLLPTIAQQAQLSPTTPVYTGIHDSNASLVPHLMSQAAPFTVVSTGTWFIVMAMGAIAVDLDESRDTLLNVNAFGEPVPSARFMGGREHELLGASETTDERSMATLLAAEDPVLLMPSQVSGTGPYPNLTSRWIGDADTVEQSYRDCAVTLYLALMTHESMRLVGSQGPTFIEGPLAHAPHFAQMIAALSDHPVLVSTAQTGTSVGAAMLISAPLKTPHYDVVPLTDTRRSELLQYASQWRKVLAEHEHDR